jgi:hypothetical protein
MSEGGTVRLIADADDLGCCTSVNRAFYDAWTKGILRNGNVIVTGGAFDEAVEMFRGAKSFCLGLHVACTCEWTTHRWKPLLPPERTASFIESDGTMVRSMMTIHERGARFDEMLAEARAQLALARRRGLDIRYLSTHMDPRWLFETSDQDRFGPHLQRWAESEGLTWRYAHLRARVPEVGDAPADPAERFAAQLRAAPAGLYYLILHPAYDDPPMREMTYDDKPPGDVARDRDGQRRMLMDRCVLTACAERPVDLVRYTDLQA